MNKGVPGRRNEASRRDESVSLNAVGAIFSPDSRQVLAAGCIRKYVGPLMFHLAEGPRVPPPPLGLPQRSECLATTGTKTTPLFSKMPSRPAPPGGRAFSKTTGEKAARCSGQTSRRPAQGRSGRQGPRAGRRLRKGGKWSQGRALSCPAFCSTAVNAEAAFFSPYSQSLLDMSTLNLQNPAMLSRVVAVEFLFVREATRW